MDPLEPILKGALVPGVVTGLLLLLTWKLPKKPAEALRLLAPALGFIAGYLLVFGTPANPMTDVLAWLFYFPLLLGLASFAHPFFQKSQSMNLVAVLGHVLLPGLFLFLLLRSYQDELLWGPLSALLGLGILSLVSLDRAGDLAKNSLGLFISEIGLTALSFVILLTGSASQAQLVGIFCAVIGACLAWNLVFSSRPVGARVIYISGFPWVMLSFVAYLYVEVPWWWLALLFLPAILLPWVIRRWIPQNWVIQYLVAGGLSFLPAGFVLFQAFKESGPLY